MIEADWNVPAWALVIADDVLSTVPKVEMRWHKTKWQRSSGWAGIGLENGGVPVLYIAAGTSRRDAKCVLLHECIHVLMPDEHHSVTFYKFLHTLVPHYGIQIEYSVWRSASSAASLRACEQLGHPRLAARMKVTRQAIDWKQAEDVKIFRHHVRGIAVPAPQRSHTPPGGGIMVRGAPQSISEIVEVIECH